MESNINEKGLGIYLQCAAKKEENWSCKCSAIIRIVSQKSGVSDIRRESDAHFKNNGNNSRGYLDFITLVELMDPEKGFYDQREDKVTLAIDVTKLTDQGNGFYNKGEDKVTLAIDLKVKNAKVAKFTHDPSKSDATISMEIEKLSTFVREVIGSERKSETVHIKGFPWKILAEIKTKNGSTDNNKKWLGFSLLCDASKEDKNWSCKCSSTLRIVSQKSGVKDYKKGEFTNEDTFNNKDSSWGYHNFISFVGLMDPLNGFYNKGEDKVTLAVDLITRQRAKENAIGKRSLKFKGNERDQSALKKKQSSPAAETVVEFLAKFDTLTASTADVGSIMNTISMNLFSFLKLTFRIGTLVAGALNISNKPESDKYKALVTLQSKMDANLGKLQKNIAVSKQVIALRGNLHDYKKNLHRPMKTICRYVAMFCDPIIEKTDRDVENFIRVCDDPDRQTPLSILDYIQTHTVEHCTIGLSSEQISLQAQFVPMLKKIRMQIRSEMEKKI
ncbi:hypothetical protein niasHT_036806 [Heterodera trifolii]|uniref:MATH domain-containing protein n=1 Tax=Heterodera trifolii TaxID=157864 RepID=A0ABD2J4F5_9BILA